MITIKKEKEFSKVAKYIPLSEAGLSEITQQLKWLRALDRAINDKHDHVVEGQRTHFEMERRKTYARIDVVTKKLNNLITKQ